MSKKIVLCSLILVGFLMAAIPAFADVTITGNPMAIGSWPTLNGQLPKVATCTDPNELPSYNADGGGSGNLRTAENFIAGRGVMQAFRTPATDGFTLKRIAIRAGGAGSDTGTYTIHLFDFNDNATDEVIDALIATGSYTPGTQGPRPGVDYISAPAFVADACMMVDANADTDNLVYFDFNGADSVDIQPNHLYAFEIWGSDEVTGYPFLWIRYGQADPYYAGNGYECPGDRSNDNGAGPENLTNFRSELGGDSRDTVLAVYGDSVDGNAFAPYPRKGSTGVSLTPTLEWHPGRWADDVNGHQVWFSTSFNQVARRLSAANKGRFTTASYTPSGTLPLNTTYYWRVDEYNDTPPPTPPSHPAPDVNLYWGENTNISGDTTDRATIWRFTTLSPAASSPVPTTGSVAVFRVTSPILSWTAGAMVQTTNGHQVYFGTNFTDVNTATTATATIYRGTTTEPNYPLASLAPAYQLASGGTYYWRVDEVNSTTTWPGTVWSFTMPNPAYVLVEDFTYSTQAALDAVWQSGYEAGVTTSSGAYLVAGSIAVDQGTLLLNYDNRDADGVQVPWSETKRDYQGAACDWTIGGALDIAAIAISYDGNCSNRINTNPIYDAIYMAIEDITGNIEVEVNPESDAVVKTNMGERAGNYSWRTWKVSLADFATPSMEDVNRLYVGVGKRGDEGGSGGPSLGQVRFDNIRLYVPHCVPEKTTLAGDFAGPYALGGSNYNPNTARDCVVNAYDLFYMVATDLYQGEYESKGWLLQNNDLNYPGATQPASSDLTVWYKFDQTSVSANGTTITDSSGNSRTGTAYQGNTSVAESFLWAADHNSANTSGRSLNLKPGYRTWVEIPASAYDNSNNEITFSFWSDYNTITPPADWPSVFILNRLGVQMDDTDANNTRLIEVQLPTPWPAAGGHNWGPQSRWVINYENSSSGLGAGTTGGAPWERMSNFAGKWNHYALVLNCDTNEAAIYLNGELHAYLQVPSSTDANAAYIPEDLWPTVGSIRIGTNSNRLHPNMGFWQGKIDDFRIYKKALTAAEAQWLATDGTGTRTQPFVEPENLKTGDTPEIVNLKDFAIMAQKWLDPVILWP